MSNSILSIGSAGIQSGLARANEAAGNIVKAGLNGDSNGDLASSIVDLKTSELLVKASAKVIKTADETVGTLIDIKA